MTPELYKNREWLYNEYWVEKKSSIMISKESGRSPATIRRWIHRLNIKMRSCKESQILLRMRKPVWNAGLHGEEYLSHYKEKKIWNKDLKKEDNESLRVVAKKLSGTNHYAWLGNKLEIVCANCGKKVRRHGLKEINRSEKLFCGQECRAEYFSGERSPRWKGGHIPYYGPNWHKQKRLVLEYDSHICQICGNPENGRKHDIHHIIPFRDFGIDNYKEANKLDNLITLCKSCHANVENNGFLLALEKNEKKGGSF